MFLACMGKSYLFTRSLSQNKNILAQWNKIWAIESLLIAGNECQEEKTVCTDRFIVMSKKFLLACN